MDSLPTASTPRDADDAEVGSRQEEEAPEVPQGNLPDFAPDSAPEPVVVPESGERPLRKKGKTVTPAASVQPEAPDNLLEALNGASKVVRTAILNWIGAPMVGSQIEESSLSES